MVGLSVGPDAPVTTHDTHGLVLLAVEHDRDAGPNGDRDAPETKGPEEPAKHASRRLGYEPALDGLRGLALLAIVVFHSELPYAPGAFLSVSTFFTLSGFLITALALRELSSTGTFSLKGFWSRRFRRLLPGAICAIGAILLLGFSLANSTQQSKIPGDALASLLYVVNWRFILSGASYGAMFQSPSPFTHFWTLSIEEQFYVVFPLLLVATFVLARGSRKALGVVFGILVAGSTIWSAVLMLRGATIDRIYFGTDTRLAEFAAGTLFALWWTSPNRRRLHFRPFAYLGAGALVVMLLLWRVAEQTDRVWYSGGLTLYACVTLAVILGALQPQGPTRQLLSVRPLVWVGKVSYAAYLIHWPVLLWLDQRGRLDPQARFVVGLAMTLLLAGLFTRFIERPIRVGDRLPGRRGALAVPFAFLTVMALVAASAITASPDRTTVDFAAAQARADALTSPGAPPSTGTSDFERYIARQVALAASTAPRVAFFGDSTALMNGMGFDDWTFEDDFATLAPQKGSANQGCGLLTSVGQIFKGKKGTVDSDCDNYLERWRAAVTDAPVDIAVVEFGTWDVLDQQLTPDGPWLTIGKDPELDKALEDALAKGVDLLRQHVKLVVLVSSPDMVSGMVDGRPPTVPFPESDPARMERFRQIVRDVADKRSHVLIADVQGFFMSRPDGWQIRPDGIHTTPETTGALGDWLGPEIKRLWDLDQGSASGSN